jgi:hypothetical protein
MVSDNISGLLFAFRSPLGLLRIFQEFGHLSGLLLTFKAYYCNNTLGILFKFQAL